MAKHDNQEAGHSDIHGERGGTWWSLMSWVLGSQEGDWRWGQGYNHKELPSDQRQLSPSRSMVYDMMKRNKETLVAVMKTACWEVFHLTMKITWHHTGDCDHRINRT